MQEIQFLKFMGGSNLPQAFQNYLIWLRFIRISTVVKVYWPKGKTTDSYVTVSD